MKKDLLAAHRYAQALFELSRGMGEDEYVEGELESFSASLKASPAVDLFLGDPSLAPGRKRALLEKVFTGKKPKIDPLLVNFLLLLFAKNRFYLIHDIASHFRKIADESQGQGVAEIRSASALSASQRESIVSRIERISGKKMVVRSEVDASLIGGVRVKVGNRVVDDSLLTKIGALKKELTKIQSI